MVVCLYCRKRIVLKGSAIVSHGHSCGLIGVGK